MKRILFLTLSLTAGLLLNAQGQSNQSPVMQQSTSTDKTSPTSEPKPMMKNVGQKQRAKMAAGLDTTLPKDRRQRRLRPDSLRRGGATKVDTIR